MKYINRLFIIFFLIPFFNNIFGGNKKTDTVILKNDKIINGFIQVKKEGKYIIIITKDRTKIIPWHNLKSISSLDNNIKERQQPASVKNEQARSLPFEVDVKGSSDNLSDTSNDNILFGFGGEIRGIYLTKSKKKFSSLGNGFSAEINFLYLQSNTFGLVSGFGVEVAQTIQNQSADSINNTHLITQLPIKFGINTEITRFSSDNSFSFIGSGLLLGIYYKPAIKFITANFGTQFIEKENQIKDVLTIDATGFEFSLIFAAFSAGNRKMLDKPILKLSLSTLPSDPLLLTFGIGAIQYF